MMDKGLIVTVNSDDPAYFGGYVNQNYRRGLGGVGARTRRDCSDRAQRDPGVADDGAVGRSVQQGPGDRGALASWRDTA